MRFSFLLLAAAAGLTFAQSTFSPLRPPAIPIAVRSPYMNTWLTAGSDGGNGGNLPGAWQTFWAGQVTAWTGFIRVDNTAYIWMGSPGGLGLYATQTAFQYTSTRSIFTLNVGGLVEMTATFLSPVTPNDLLRSSLPYTYLEVDVRSIDGNNHAVQLYTDISAEWVTGDHSANAQWSFGIINGQTVPSGAARGPTPAAVPAQTIQTTFGTLTDIPSSSAKSGPFGFQSTSASSSSSTTVAPLASRALGARDVAPSPTHSAGGLAYHQVYRQQQLEFSETNQQADWGNWYYATDNTQALTYQSGQDAVVRRQFIDSGYLADTQDSNFRGINNNWPVFGFALDLGSVGAASQSSLFQLSLHQQQAVQFEGANGVQPVPSLWTSYFGDDLSAVDFFYYDYANGQSIATSFDNQVSSDSLAAGGQNYLSLTSLAARQAFGALEFTNTPAAPYVFLKEISSDGNVQTVDVIFPFHPIAIYTNPQILKWMLDPLFIHQEAGHWPYLYSIHDIGSSFPNAIGHDDGIAEPQPLEECGDMLIMTLAYAQRANDNAYLAQHYNILSQWTQFLIQEALIPANQISTDDFAGSLANQTNLALKGIIGIQAMAQIAYRTGNVADGDNFTQIAQSYIQQWQGFAINYNAAPPHTTLDYGDLSSYGLLYNLFGDAELGLQLVPRSVYDIQSSFYPTVFNAYGVPLDTRHAYTKNDWEIFCAAIASPSTRDEFTAVIAQWLNQTPTNLAFTDLYDTVSGNYPGITFIARPVVGGMFAFLALNSAPTSSAITAAGP